MYNTNMNDISIDLTSLLPPTNSPAKQTTYKTKNGVSKSKPYKTSTITPAKKVFSEVYAKTDNGAKAVRAAYPELANSSVQSVSTKAGRLLKNAEVVNHIEYQRNKLEQLATRAVNKVEDLIESDNEQIATTNTWKVIEQVHGKAMQKSSNVNFNFTGHVSDKAQDYGL